MIMIKGKLSSYILLIISGMIVFSLQSCDNPVDDDEIGDHANAIGFAVKIDGEELFRYARRDYDLNPDGEFDEWFEGDSLKITPDLVDGDGQTPEMQLRWVNRDDELFDLPELTDDDGEWSLRFDKEALEGADEPLSFVYDKEESTWTFKKQANGNGLVTVVYNLWHIDHPDMESTRLHVLLEGFDD